MAGIAIHKGNRHFPNGEPKLLRPQNHLYLEGVAGGADLLQRDGLQDLALPGLEAAREVSVWEEQDYPGEDAATAADYAAEDR